MRAPWSATIIVTSIPMLQNRAKEAESATLATQVERAPPNQPANQQPTHTHTPPNTPKLSKMPAGTVNKSTTEGRKTQAGTATDTSLAGGCKGYCGRAGRGTSRGSKGD